MFRTTTRHGIYKVKAFFISYSPPKQHNDVTNVLNYQSVNQNNNNNKPDNLDIK